MTYDLNYFTDIFSKLCGIPGRIYHNNIKINFFSTISFPKDPAVLIEKELVKYKNNIGYIYADDFYYYGYVNSGDKMILLGPSRLVKSDDTILSKMALDLKIDKNDINDFKIAMSSLVPIPLESLLQALCSLNYVLNNEKVNIKDILFDNTTNDSINTNQEPKYDFEASEHNTYDIENNLLRIVQYGEIDELNEWLKKAPPVRGGILSSDALRQLKNTFIVTATLESRASIKGGLDVNEALTLSDLYIQKMETMNLYTDITELQLKMLFDYTERVARIRGKSNASPFLLDINKYIYSHISEPIKSNDICKALYISKSVLFDKIKKETGKTVSEYILNIKINESKGILKYTDKPISSISLYLGFSSQSHYNRTFKELTDMTPKKYRETHKK